MVDSFPEQPELDPASLSSGHFTRSRRGFEPVEVNQLLGKAADALRTWQLRDRSLLRRIEELEAELTDARKLDEGRIAAVLGEETARVISAAREAAAEIRAKAEEHAARVIQEAEEAATASSNALRSEAEALRAEAETLREQATKEYAAKLDEAQQRYDELVGSAQERHDELLSSAQQRHDELVEAGARVLDERTSEAETVAEKIKQDARNEGRDMLAEAKAVRDRVLADLAERRRVARRQIEGAIVGRDRVIEVMRQAGAHLADVIGELDRAEDEARDSANVAVESLGDDSEEFLAGLDISDIELPAPAAEPGAPEAVVDQETGDRAEEATVEPEPELTGDDEAGDVIVVDAEETAAAAADPEADQEAGDQDESSAAGSSGEDDSGATVHDLFARIRAQGLEETVEVEEADDWDDLDEADETVPLGAAVGAEDERPDPGPSPSTNVVELATAETASDEDPAQAAELARIAAVSELLDARDELLLPVERQLLRALRRLASDEQNEVLDRLRRHKRGRPEIDEVVPAASEMLESFARGVGEDFAAAIEAGYTFWGQAGGVSATPLFELPSDAGDRLETILTEFIAVHRAHLERAMQQATETGVDLEDLTQSIKAVYRDWRQGSLAEIASDITIAGFSHGERLAAGPGAPWRWVVDNGGLPCADGEDNALAGTVLSDEAFPTGDLAPPAHSGCRCILVPAHN